VVQTSSMDCGPAALSCLLTGHHLPGPYGRLREVCQTSVDGTSIDTLEEVANRLGLVAEQQMLPPDQLFLGEQARAPALLVLRQPDGAAHFVVLWRRQAGWVQVMDPAAGRRWWPESRLAGQLYEHEVELPADAWREWAGGEGLAGWLERLQALQVAEAQALVDAARADTGWLGLAALDAALREVRRLVELEALRPGAEAEAAVRALARAGRALWQPPGAAASPGRTHHAGPADDTGAGLPRSAWAVWPADEAAGAASPHLRLRGAVLVRVPGRQPVEAPPAVARASGAAREAAPAAARASGAARGAVPAAAPGVAAGVAPGAADLGPAPAADVAARRGPDANATVATASTNTLASGDDALDGAAAELQSVRGAPEPSPWPAAWAWLAEGGRRARWALLLGAAASAATLVVEALLLRAALDGAAAPAGVTALALAGFVVLLLGLELPLIAESQRLGRRLELALRRALVQRLPQLHDRYFQSRPLADMADRAHALVEVRALPTLAVQTLQALVELSLTLLALAWIAPATLGGALALGALAVALPLALRPWLAEADLRVRHHGAALHGFVLDALQGLVPLRAHRAGRLIRRQHEARLADWTRATRRAVVTALGVESAVALACAVIASALLWQQYTQPGGLDLLAVFWLLKLPALGTRLAGLAPQWPAQRHVLMRLQEPLRAAEADQAAIQAAADAAHAGAAAARSAEPPMGPSGTPAGAGPAPPAARATPPATEPTGSLAAASQHPSAPKAADGSRMASDGASMRFDAALSTSLAGASPPPATLSFSAVEVRAGGHPVLTGLDLAIAPGEHVALVGVSGAGKSSLIGLCLGWHRAAAGRWSIDGQPATPARVDALRRATAWVDPAVQLWNASLLDNLLYASPDRPETLDALPAALRAAGLDERLPQLDAGLQTLLGEGGARLSGGEGQRVRLARALLQPGVRLVLLDEPFRGLARAQREAALQAARRHWAGCTLVCATHDVDATLGFDRVLVLDGGRLVQTGRPAELTHAPGPYRDALAAEARLRREAWGDAGWRCLWLEQGRLVEAAESEAPR
jgi:ATP-binding cassette subfamily B protein